MRQTGITHLHSFGAANGDRLREGERPVVSRRVDTATRRIAGALFAVGAPLLIALLALEIVEQAQRTATELQAEGRRWLAQLEDPASWAMPRP